MVRRGPLNSVKGENSQGNPSKFPLRVAFPMSYVVTLRVEAFPNSENDLYVPTFFATSPYSDSWPTLRPSQGSNPKSV